MSLSEFTLINKYFRSLTGHDNTVDIGIGDDAAVINFNPEQQLVVSVDTSIAGVHFPEDADAYAIGYRCLAVNISDIAAMGAIPRWFTLAITLPEVKEFWLAGFSKGMASLAERHKIQLIGGDTTRGQLSISVQIMGVITPGQALRRSGAQPGDDIYVSGPLGDAAAGLHLYQQDKTNATDFSRAETYLLNRYLCPQPQLKMGLLLRDYASSCIDISDGLLADLGHILKQSSTAGASIGASLNVANIPLSTQLQTLQQSRDINMALLQNWALSGGDDYQLCFTVPTHKKHKLLDAMNKQDLSCYSIGCITDSGELMCKNADASCDTTKPNKKTIAGGYQHF